MKEIDNFDFISSFLNFQDKEDDFFDVEILRRGKDNPNLPSANYLVKSYFIQSISQLFDRKDEIINLCKTFNARAYINMTRKSFRKTMMLALSITAQRAYMGDFKKPYKIFHTAVGKVEGDDKRWIIDVDDDDIEKCYELCDFINEGCKPDNLNKTICILPTMNGFHIISKPFELFKFKNRYNEIEVKKNHLTLLYYSK